MSRPLLTRRMRRLPPPDRDHSHRNNYATVLFEIGHANIARQRQDPPRRPNQLHGQNFRRSPCAGRGNRRRTRGQSHRLVGPSPARNTASGQQRHRDGRLLAVHHLRKQAHRTLRCAGCSYAIFRIDTAYAWRSLHGQSVTTTNGIRITYAQCSDVQRAPTPASSSLDSPHRRQGA